MAGSGRVDFGLVRAASREALSKLLDGVSGNKAIVWEKELAGSFSLVGDFSYLRSHGVTQMFYLSGEHARSPSQPNIHIVFITKPHTASMDAINTYIRGLSEGTSERQLHLWLVPRCSLLCERRLQEHGIFEHFTSVNELPLLFFQLEADLVSMELPGVFREWSVEGDPSAVHAAARALMLLQAIYGLIPSIRGKGPNVAALYNIMVELRREMAHNEPQVPSKIDQLIIVERSVDLITPLATQLTYEGLIDLCFGIKNSVVKLPSSKLQQSGGEGEGGDGVGSLLDPQAPTVKPVLLSSSDQLYAEIRDANFSAVGPRLASQAKQITKEFEERHLAKTVVEMKHFVQKLPRIQAAKQSLALHTSIAEALQEEVAAGLFGSALEHEQELLRGGIDCDKVPSFIEESIGRKAPLNTVLRLICLQSVINNGLRPKLLEYYKRELVQTYGYHHILTLDNLGKAGLLTAQQQKSNYATMRKTLRLIVDDVNELNPSDISYVHSGYAPLSVSLARYVHTPGWRAITDLLSVLPGPTLAETQHVARHRRTESISNERDSSPVVLVFFLGGCTYSEVAALRFLTNKMHDNGDPEYVIATTSFINHDSFLESLSTPLLV
ncbi:Sec1-like protein [Trinorchestia longiramus]|nr:Sec1-like protein [Trinorchestia longiramus]